MNSQDEGPAHAYLLPLAAFVLFATAALRSAAQAAHSVALTTCDQHTRFRRLLIHSIGCLLRLVDVACACLVFLIVRRLGTPAAATAAVASTLAYALVRWERIGGGVAVIASRPSRTDRCDGATARQSWQWHGLVPATSAASRRWSAAGRGLTPATPNAPPDVLDCRGCERDHAQSPEHTPLRSFTVADDEASTPPAHPPPPFLCNAVIEHRGGGNSEGADESAAGEPTSNGRRRRGSICCDGGDGGSISSASSLGLWAAVPPPSAVWSNYEQSATSQDLPDKMSSVTDSAHTFERGSTQSAMATRRTLKP